MSGKLQVFYDNEYLFSATLRRNKEGFLFPFTLRIRNQYDRVIYIGGFETARSAKGFLESYPTIRARWFTHCGYVEDDD